MSELNQYYGMNFVFDQMVEICSWTNVFFFSIVGVTNIDYAGILALEETNKKLLSGGIKVRI